MTTTEQLELLGEKKAYLQTLNKKKRKALKAQLAKLTFQQLVALAVQKQVLPYCEARVMSADTLREKLFGIEGVLKSVPV